MTYSRSLIISNLHLFMGSKSKQTSKNSFNTPFTLGQTFGGFPALIFQAMTSAVSPSYGNSLSSMQLKIRAKLHTSLLLSKTLSKNFSGDVHISSFLLEEIYTLKVVPTEFIALESPRSVNLTSPLASIKIDSGFKFQHKMGLGSVRCIQSMMSASFMAILKLSSGSKVFYLISQESQTPSIHS